MTIAEQRAVDAAGRVLRAHARRPQCRRTELEWAAWVLGRAGSTLPALADPEDELRVREAALLGAGDFDAVEALIEAQTDRERADALLMEACTLAGPIMPDRLIEIAHRHRSPWFSGPRLARTSRVDRLLALFDGKPLLDHAFATIGELVVLGRDRGEPIPEAEVRWAEIVGRAVPPEYSQNFRDVRLRITVRESLEEGIDLLEDHDAVYERWEVSDGMEAVLARLVVVDPERAVAIVGSKPAPQDQVEWFRGLSWWRFALPTAADAMLTELLGHGDPEIDLWLAAALTPARAHAWLERTLATSAAIDPHTRARDLSPGVHHLRLAGFEDEAERVRSILVPHLPDTGTGDLAAPLDLFDVRSAPQTPSLVPWGGGRAP